MITFLLDTQNGRCNRIYLLCFFWAQYGFNLKKLTCVRNYGQKLSAELIMTFFPVNLYSKCLFLVQPSVILKNMP